MEFPKDNRAGMSSKTAPFIEISELEEIVFANISSCQSVLALPKLETKLGLCCLIKSLNSFAEKTSTLLDKVL